jgi:glutathione S-transferase
MKLYYSHRSPYVRLVMVVIHWGKLASDIELMNTVVNIEKPLPGLMADNPLTKIPTLLAADGEAIYDSRVICEYLDSRHAEPKLFPAHGPQRWEALRRLGLGHGLIDLLLAWFTERNRPEAARSQPFIDALRAKYEATIARLEGEAPQLQGSAFTVGHVAIGVALSYSDFRFPTLNWREGHPQLAQWHSTFTTIPAVAADPFFDDLAAAKALKEAAR